MIKQKLVLVFIFTNILTSGFSQEAINQFDKNGERHGRWTKTYDNTNQIRYEGVFDHGKEVGDFKYYTLKGGKSVLSAVKSFVAETNIAKVKFFTSNGKLISEGTMDGINYIGDWFYYHQNTSQIMTKEKYNENGELNGEKEVFYKNGLIAERTNYSNGKLEGDAVWYSEMGKILKSYTYKNDELNGVATYYDSEENITSKGEYKDNKKFGIWEYFDNSVLKKRIDHTNQKILTKDN